MYLRLLIVDDSVTDPHAGTTWPGTDAAPDGRGDRTRPAARKSEARHRGPSAALAAC